MKTVESYEAARIHSRVEIWYSAEIMLQLPEMCFKIPHLFKLNRVAILPCWNLLAGRLGHNEMEGWFLESSKLMYTDDGINPCFNPSCRLCFAHGICFFGSYMEASFVTVQDQIAVRQCIDIWGHCMWFQIPEYKMRLFTLGVWKCQRAQVEMWAQEFTWPGICTIFGCLKPIFRWLCHSICFCSLRLEHSKTS